VLISFFPTPAQFFNHPQSELSSFSDKYKLLNKLSLDAHLIIAFNAAFSQLSAHSFVQQILINQLQTKICLVGDDFKFGAHRQGDFNFLQQFDFTSKKTKSVLVNNQRVSSSYLRHLLQNGDFLTAEKMLGRAFSISGTVLHGQQRGRSINFPTINLSIKRKISPLSGVFAVEILLSGKTHQGVANIGNRPTVGGNQTLLEVFIFNFNQTVYGEKAQIIFKHKIRNEQKFNTFEQLKIQIQHDTITAKNYFKI
jgi:riboflavin kinase/FMN adenylyltransferase